MKVYLRSRMALLYKGNFDQMEELNKILTKLKIEMRLIEEDALPLSVAMLSGYVDTPSITKEYTGDALDESCIVFSGLTEEVLNRALDAIRENEIAIDYKAVVTNDNRNWAFGALMVELGQEKHKIEEN